MRIVQYLVIEGLWGHKMTLYDNNVYTRRVLQMKTLNILFCFTRNFFHNYSFTTPSAFGVLVVTVLKMLTNTKKRVTSRAWQVGG